MSDILEEIQKQKDKVTNTTLSYLALFPETAKVEGSKFAKDLDWYYEDEELIPDNDLLPVAEEFIVNTLKEYKVDAKIDKVKLMYFFENSETVECCAGESVLDEEHDTFAEVLSCDLRTKNNKTLKDWEEQRAEFDKALSLELEKYTAVIEKYKDNMKMTSSFKKFVNLFPNHELMVLNVFMTRVIYSTLKTYDFMVATNTMKTLVKEMTILARGIKLFQSIEKEEAQKEFRNDEYIAFLKTYRKDYKVVIRYLHYHFVKNLITIARKSVGVRETLMKGGINRITINSLLYFFSHHEKEAVREGINNTFYEISMRDFTTLKSKFNDSKLHVVYFSFGQMDRNDSLKAVKSACDGAFSSFNFYSFERDNVFDIWTNNHDKVDIVFLEDSYDQRQDNHFFDMIENEKYGDMFKNTKYVILSTGKKIDNKKELMKISSNVLPLPLEKEVVHKYLLTL
jgi:hypothetical protein